MKKIYKPISGLVAACLLTAFSFDVYAADIPVTNTNNLGPGSLSDAITTANSTPGLDTITFALPEGFSMTIAPTTALPDITEAVFINGYSQPGAVLGSVATRTIRVNIDGAGLPVTANIFTISATNVTIAGLAIYRAPNFGSGIRINGGGDNAWIWGNYIGTDSTGLATGLGNTYDGIVCNTFNGTPVTGVVVGVKGLAPNSFAHGNLISANGEDGIFFWRTQSSVIAGNIIGFDKNGGGTGFGNVRNGILATQSSSGNVIGTDGDGAFDNLESNRIGNNGGRGILVATISDFNVIAGNVVGVSATNTAAGNGQNGIEINPGSGNRIGTNGDGTSDALERNTICANNGDGILIVGGDFFGGSNSDGNVIAGNAIGTNGAGTLVLGNTNNGITIQTNTNFSANDNIIGSNEDFIGDDLEGNVIANNVRGVVIATPAGTSTVLGNRISRNSIYDNTQLGIDLGADGITANDNGDADSGPNELFNFPIIKKANVQGGQLVISGVAPAGALIEFYIADANGSEGRTYLFTAQEGGSYLGINDDSTGTDSYSDVTYGSGTDEQFGFSVTAASLPATVTTGTVIIAVATKTSPSVGSTSEFGPSFISTLPVRFGQFNGRADKGIVYLDWNTSQEVNNSHFDVERSSNGNSFEKIGSVQARGGISNSYSFTDSKPGPVNFYRLKQVDKNGASTYSRTVLIRGDLDKIGAKISPNPFVGAVNISFQASKKETVTVRLFNQTGQLVKQQSTTVNSGVNTINLNDLSTLPAGNYTIELRGESLQFRQQVVKQ